MKDDGRTCVDIDECSSGFPCSQQCINTYGTYKCLCADGYEVHPNNHHGCKSLSGIDESCWPSVSCDLEMTEFNRSICLSNKTVLAMCTVLPFLLLSSIKPLKQGSFHIKHSPSVFYY